MSKKEELAKKLTEKMNVAPPMTTRVQTNTQFFAPVIHDTGNTSLFDEEDEMNMSMDSGNQNRLSGLSLDSPVKRDSVKGKKGGITNGLTEAVIEVDEEEDPKN